jgi:hypothetical protein
VNTVPQNASVNTVPQNASVNTVPQNAYRDNPYTISDLQKLKMGMHSSGEQLRVPRNYGIIMFVLTIVTILLS